MTDLFKCDIPLVHCGTLHGTVTSFMFDKNGKIFPGEMCVHLDIRTGELLEKVDHYEWFDGKCHIITRNENEITT